MRKGETLTTASIIVGATPIKPPARKPRRWLGVQEFRERFALTPEHLDVMLIFGDIHAVKLGGRQFIALTAIERWMKETIASHNGDAGERRRPIDLTPSIN